jgi:hypothetical protein
MEHHIRYLQCKDLCVRACLRACARTHACVRVRAHAQACVQTGPGPDPDLLGWRLLLVGQHQLYRLELTRHFAETVEA